MSQEIEEPSFLRCPGCGPRLAHTDTATSLLTDADPGSLTAWTPTSGMVAVRIASPGVMDETARFLEATAPAVSKASASSSTRLAALQDNPFAPVQHPGVCGPVYGLGADKQLSIDVQSVLDGVTDDARRAELVHLYRCVHICLLHGLPHAREQSTMLLTTVDHRVVGQQMVDQRCDTSSCRTAPSTWPCCKWTS